jgi:hypothetical protein
VAVPVDGTGTVAVAPVVEPPVPGVQKPPRWVGKQFRDHLVAAPEEKVKKPAGLTVARGIGRCPQVFAIVVTREYELLTEAHAQLSVIVNCSRFCLLVLSASPHPLLLLTIHGSPAVPLPPDTHPQVPHVFCPLPPTNTRRARIWSSFGRRKV